MFVYSAILLLPPPPSPSAEVTLLFGRGMRAGIDRREQKKQAAAMEGEILRKGREAAGIEETLEMKQVQRDREDRAAKYDAQDMVVSARGEETGGGGVRDLQAIMSTPRV